MSKSNTPQQLTLEDLNVTVPCDQGFVQTEAFIDETTNEVTVRISVHGFALDQSVQQPQLAKSARSFGGVVNVTDLSTTGLTLHFEDGRTDDLKAFTMQVSGIRREAVIKLNSINRQRNGKPHLTSAPNSPFNRPEPIAGATRMTKNHFASLNGF